VALPLDPPVFVCPFLQRTRTSLERWKQNNAPINQRNLFELNIILRIMNMLIHNLSDRSNNKKKSQKFSKKKSNLND